jgi:hypothetical protein
MLSKYGVWMRVWLSISLVCWAFSAMACGRTSDEQVGAEVFEPDADCVSTPQLNQDNLARNVSSDEAISGCREFGPQGCSECCSPTNTPSGQTDCLALGPTGERLTGSPCEPNCPACARCSLEDEASLYDLARSVKCDCSILEGRLGFDPDVPCERDCYYLKSAALSCPHKVCREHD